MCDNERIRDIFKESENTWRAMHEFGSNRARKNLAAKAYLFIQSTTGSTIINTAMGDSRDEQLVGIGGDLVGSFIFGFIPFGEALNLNLMLSGNSVGDKAKELYQYVKSDLEQGWYYTYHKDFQVMEAGFPKTIPYAKILHHSNGEMHLDPAKQPYFEAINQYQYENYSNLKNDIENLVFDHKFNMEVSFYDDIMEVNDGQSRYSMQKNGGIGSAVIRIDNEKCNLCEECVRACSLNVLKIKDEKLIIANSSDCNFCKDCEERCVLKAIEICEFR